MCLLPTFPPFPFSHPQLCNALSIDKYICIVMRHTSRQPLRQVGRGRHQSVQTALPKRSHRNGSRLPVVVLGHDLASGIAVAQPAQEQTPRPLSQRMPIYVGSTTTMPCHCCQLVCPWKYTSRQVTLSLGTFIPNQRGISTPQKNIAVHICT